MSGTWRWERSCATWVYELWPAGRALPATMAEGAGRAMAALPGFAVPVAAEWTTDSAGEDAVVHDRGTPIDGALLARTFRAHPDVLHLALDLDLLVDTGTAPEAAGPGTVLEDAGPGTVLEDAGRLQFEREERLILIWLDLHVDLYAARTFGPERDNRVLAARNAPRLAGFLERLRAGTGADFHSVDAPGYEVSEHGFTI